MRNGGRRQLFNTDAFMNSAAGESACDGADGGRATEVALGAAQTSTFLQPKQAVMKRAEDIKASKGF